MPYFRTLHYKWQSQHLIQIGMKKLPSPKNEPHLAGHKKAWGRAYKVAKCHTGVVEDIPGHMTMRLEWFG